MVIPNTACGKRKGGGLNYKTEYDRLNNMAKKNRAKYKISKIGKPKKCKVGNVTKYNKNLEPHEDNTIECLSKYGMDVVALASSNMPGSINPDLLMLGTFWEMKAPTTNDSETIATHFRKAIKQSGGKAVFDLRGEKNNQEKTYKDLLRLFETTRGMRRLLVILKTQDGEEILDIIKK